MSDTITLQAPCPSAIVHSGTSSMSTLPQDINVRLFTTEQGVRGECTLRDLGSCHPLPTFLMLVVAFVVPFVAGGLWFKK